MLHLYAERLADIVLSPTETEHLDNHIIPKIEGNLVLKVENVSFRYAENEPYVFSKY